jgi:hypothetical protein
MRYYLSVRPLLWFDAATCLALGLLLAVAGGSIAPLLGLPIMLLNECAILLCAFAAAVGFIATRSDPVAGTKVIAAANAGWVAASFALLAGPWVEPTAFGTAFVAAQALAVAGIAILELRAARVTAANAA